MYKDKDDDLAKDDTKYVYCQFPALSFGVKEFVHWVRF
jgi:hypothetical protein